MRRFGIIPALFLGVMAISGTAMAGAPTVAPLARVLPAAFARTARTWPRVDNGFGGRAIATALETRTVRSIRLGRGAGVVRADTLLGRRDHSIDPRQVIYSSFRIGPDTLRFTYGHMAEEFGGVPRMILASPGASPRSLALPPLAHWNIDAVWYTGDYLIFGCTFEPEGSVRYEQIALWHLPSGRWYTSPREEAFYHRGFKLRETLGDWRTASVSTAGASVVLAGSSAALVLTPDSGSWALVDEGGRAIPPPEHKVSRRLAPVTAAMQSRLRAPLLAAFREWNHGVDSVQILEVMRDPCLAHRGAAAIVVRGTGPPPTVNAADSRDIQATMNSQLFGVFVADSALSSITSRVDMFPTSRYGDYIVYFDLEAPDDGMAVYGQGETYGDAETERTYSCGN